MEQPNLTEFIRAVAEECSDTDVADHIRQNTASRNGAMWLPAVYSERDDVLRAKLIAELGSPCPSGYMSEECGWDL